jgi:predicted flap endonuclease-1-like 5' DNA nuclease
VGKQQLSETDLKREEDENQDLRDKLAAQREETKVEQKNAERLRSELAHLKTKMAALRPNPSMISRSELDRARADHFQEIRLLKSKQQSEVDELNRRHRIELTRLKSEHQTALSEHDQRAIVHEQKELSHIGDELGVLSRELADLRKQNAAFRQENTQLQEAQSELAKRLRAAEEQASATPGGADSRVDDLTELKGVGPKVALALRAAGITSFAQIASWTDSDIAEIAPKIKTAVNRIRNNEWVAQAQRRMR